MVDRIKTDPISGEPVAQGTNTGETQVVHKGAVAQDDVAFKENDGPEFEPTDLDSNAELEANNKDTVNFKDREKAKNNVSPTSGDRSTQANEQAADLSATDDRPDSIEAKKKQFEADQEAAKKNFEREQKGTINKMERDNDFAKAKAERDGKIAQRRMELQDKAFVDGVITHDQLVARNGLNAPHAIQGVLQPHEVLANDEKTVLMAFPRTVVLTLSAEDVKRWHDHAPTAPGATPVSHGSRVVFYQGYEDVPEGLADHGYLTDAGAYRVDDNGKPEKAEDRTKRLAKAKEDQEKSKKDKEPA